MRTVFRCFLACSLLGSASLLTAASSTTWETTGFSEWLKGRLSGLSVTSDGFVQPGPATRWDTALGQPALWALAAALDGVQYAATGHGGKVYRIDKSGRSTLFWTATQPEVFALAVDQIGRVWAGTSPSGAVYRLGDHPVEVWRSPEHYIWSIAPAPDGSLFVATGDKGRVYRIDSSGKGALYYETGQANVTALAVGPNGHVYAGTEPNGIIYEISEAGKAAILYDSSLPEVRSLALAADGTVYAAVMGGAISNRGTTATANATSATSATVTSATPTVITVTEATETQSGAKLPDAAARASATQAAASTNTTAAGTVTEVSGVDKSAIYRIAPDHTVETLRTSKDDNVYDLFLNGDDLVFATDDHGRVYAWNAGKIRLLAELGASQASRLLPLSPGNFLVGTSNPARVLSFGERQTNSPKPWAESQVHDAGSVARWGHIWSRPNPRGITYQVRTGNSQRPDNTWGPWTDASSAISSSVARFVQWRAEWDGRDSAPVDAISLSYLPQNTPPVIRSVTASSVIGANAAKNAATAASSSAAYSITVTDTGEATSNTTTVGPNQTVSRLQTTQTQVSWQADDPDGDKLVYALYFRPDNGHAWQLIRSRMYENTLLLDPDVFADDRYFFRVLASDSPSNPAPQAKQAELVSAAVLVDNTPPLVTLKLDGQTSTSVDLLADATDQTSPLKKAEYSVDAGWWQPVEATDGITDTPHEQFRIHLEKLRPGEHLIVVRVYDSPGNAGLAKFLLP